MSSTLNNILEYMIWLICLFIVIRFIIPALSSLIREKITGESQKEIFNLDELISKEKQKILIKEAQSKTLFERVLVQRRDKETLDFLQTANFSNHILEELVAEARDIWQGEQIESIDLKTTLEKIIRLDGIENSPLIQLDILKRAIVFYSLPFRKSERKVPKDADQKLFNQSYHLIGQRDIPLKKLTDIYKEADFTDQLLSSD